MIACYAWTDTQIINILQVCRTRYPESQADLFVLSLDRVSKELLCILRKQKSFRTIVEIEPPTYETACKNRKMILGVKTIYQGRKYQQYFDAVVNEIDQDIAYHLFLTSGFWAESLHMLRAVTKRGSPIAVHIVEEGLYSYVKNSFLCRIDHPKKERLERYLRYGFFYQKAYRMVQDICLYEPKNIQISTDKNLWAIPKIDCTFGFWSALFQQLVPKALVEQYQNRKFIYLVGARKALYEPDYTQTNHILTLAMSHVDPAEFVVRLHPTLYEQDLTIEPMDGLFIDKEKYWFEAMCTQLAMTTKVIIARNSTILNSLQTLGVPFPKVMMTYKLYDYYRSYGDPIRDQVVSRVGKYTKVYVPESMTEFNELVYNLSIQDEDGDSTTIIE